MWLWVISGCRVNDFVVNYLNRWNGRFTFGWLVICHCELFLSGSKGHRLLRCLGKCWMYKYRSNMIDCILFFILPSYGRMTEDG